MDNLVQLLRRRAFEQPDRTAYTFLLDEAVGPSVTYASLDRRVRAVAARLQQLNAAGERVLLLYSPGLDYIIAYFACLYTGAIAVPAYPPRHNRHLGRVQAIASDADTQLALTTASLLSQAATVLDAESRLARLHLIASDCIAEELADEWTGVEIESESLAHLQYTSGSTATPKGVMVTHGNLMHNSEYIARGFAHSPESVSLTWLPHFHDMGLLDGVIQPLYNGFPAFLMSPATFLGQPYLWLRAISRFRVTHSGGPNFAYDLCVRSIGEPQLATLDLSSWRVAYNGAEPIRADSLARFADRFSSCGFRRSAFYPAYGLAEATLKVTGGSCADEPVFLTAQRDALKQNCVVEAEGDDVQVTTLVSVGRPSLDTHVRIVDPETRRECTRDQIGEIWIAGPSVARGYWNRPDETEETFHARVADTGEGPYLRTGDLGFLKDGELYVTGRVKDVIIIRGLNHYPQDIELTVDTSNPFVRPGCGAAFSIEVEGAERLVVVQEMGRRQPSDVATVIADVRRAIAEQHELQAYAVVLVRLGTVSKTSSGKIQRRACRAAFLAGELDVLASDVIADETSETSHIFLNRETVLALDPDRRQAALESYLLAHSARVLKVGPEQISVESSLTSFGLDSLGAVELKNRFETDLQINLSIGTLLEARQVSQVAADLLKQLLAQTDESARTTMTIPDGETEYQLSATQEALWFLQQMTPESTAYNVAVAMRATPTLDAAIVRKSFEILIQRHDSLRTTFGVRDGQPIQKVHQDCDVCFQEVDGSRWDDVELRRQLVEAAHRPFHLADGPVVRAYLFQVSPAESIFVLNAHHLVVDGWSYWLLLREFRELYTAQLRGETIPTSPRRASFADFVKWQQELLASPEAQRMWLYWERELSGELPVVRLFSGRSQATTQTFAGDSHCFQLQGELVAGLRSLAQAEGATLYTVLLAAFQTLLQRYTAQDDILVGSPVAARTRAEFSDVVGCFFNAVVLRADLSSDPTFKEFLQQIRAKVVGALEHQDYPSHVLTQRLRAERDLGRRELFQVSFIMQKLSGVDASQSDSRPSAADFSWRPVVLERRGARAELELELIESESSIEALLQYSTDLCDAATAARMAHHYANLLRSILAEPDSRISRLRLLDETERQQLLRMNGAPKHYSDPICVPEIFKGQVAKTPEKIVAVDAHGTLTYHELNAQADKLAALIQGLTR
ncbi:MAG TPA: condensation domain-containing protein [Pyrinomonadaceae bacterium]|nr:condensation domain-containing protein [Pyrinomonadaceae bacterium]